MASPKPKAPVAKRTMPAVPKANKKLMPKKMTGEEAAKRYQKEISPKGMASASAAQKKALDKKYPGLYKSATPKPKVGYDGTGFKPGYKPTATPKPKRK